MKNILRMFLSDVKTRKEGDKVKINETTYTNVDGEKTLTTNESAVRYLIKTTPLDKIFIFASKKVRDKIAFVNRKTKESFLYFDDNQKTWTRGLKISTQERAQSQQSRPRSENFPTQKIPADLTGIFICTALLSRKIF